MFSVKYKEIEYEGMLIYDLKESTFYYEPWNDVDFSIILGSSYIGLDLNLYENKILQMSGYSSKRNWIKKRLTIPDGSTGELYISKLDKNWFSGSGVIYDISTNIYFDINTGWICIGNLFEEVSYKNVVEFAKDSIAVINNEGVLLSLYIRPIIK